MGEASQESDALSVVQAMTEPRPADFEAAREAAWERDKDIASAFDHPNGRVAYRNLKEAHGLGFTAGYEARQGEGDVDLPECPIDCGSHGCVCSYPKSGQRANGPCQCKPQALKAAVLWWKGQAKASHTRADAAESGWDAAETAARELRVRVEELEREKTAEYVRGWNDGEADAESLRVRVEELEAMLGGMERLQVENKEVVDRVQGAGYLATGAAYGAVQRMSAAVKRAEEAEARVHALEAERDNALYWKDMADRRAERWRLEHERVEEHGGEALREAAVTLMETMSRVDGDCVSMALYCRRKGYDPHRDLDTSNHYRTLVAEVIAAMAGVESALATDPVRGEDQTIHDAVVELTATARGEGAPENESVPFTITVVREVAELDPPGRGYATHWRARCDQTGQNAYGATPSEALERLSRYMWGVLSHHEDPARAAHETGEG